MIVGGGHTSDTGATPHTFKLKPNGEADYLWEFGEENFEFDAGYSNEMVFSDDGKLVVATDNLNTGNTGIKPLVYKVDTLGNVQWSVVPSYDYYPQQWNKNLVKSADGGYLCIGHQYTSYGEHPPDGNWYDWHAWLIKISEDGVIEWERFYRYVTEDFDKHAVYDLKATADGGYIFCGEATDLCYTENCHVSQQGWIVKVDACGCLVPGCDPDCFVGIESHSEPADGKRFMVGPNPVSQMLNIFVGEDFPVGSEFKLIDSIRRVAKSFTATETNITYIWDVEELAAGMYTLSLFDGKKVLQSEKIIRQ